MRVHLRKKINSQNKYKIYYLLNFHNKIMINHILISFTQTIRKVITLISLIIKYINKNRINLLRTGKTFSNKITMHIIKII
jgi:hypothetical protein